MPTENQLRQAVEDLRDGDGPATTGRPIGEDRRRCRRAALTTGLSTGDTPPVPGPHDRRPPAADRRPTGDDPDGFRPENLVHARDDGEIEMHVNELYWLANLSGLDVCQKTDYRWVDQLTEPGLLEAGVYQHFEGMPYSADAATLTQAVSVVGSNAAVEVAAQRRLRRLIRESDSALEWLARRS